jgi:hypothetical protein
MDIANEKRKIRTSAIESIEYELLQIDSKMEEMILSDVKPNNQQLFEIIKLIGNIQGTVRVLKNFN